MSSADDQYEQANDTVQSGVPAGDSKDNDYASRSGQYQIPVQKDDAPVNDPIDPATADSDETLGMFGSCHKIVEWDELIGTQRRMMLRQLTRAML